jgi:hypothetical protein
MVSTAGCIPVHLKHQPQAESWCPPPDAVRFIISTNRRPSQGVHRQMQSRSFESQTWRRPSHDVPNRKDSRSFESPIWRTPGDVFNWKESYPIHLNLNFPTLCRQLMKSPNGQLRLIESPFWWTPCDEVFNLTESHSLARIRSY